MSRKRRRKRETHSTIKQHRRHKKTLTPPLATVPKLHSSSWLNDWLPEMLWTALIIAGLPRQNALETFRRVADFVSQFPDEDFIYDITHTGLSRIDAEILKELLEIITATDAHRVVLSPLLLLRELPARETWVEALDASASDASWRGLMQAVALTLDHQSQEATECRWVRVICLMSTGKAVVPPEFVKEIAYYPNYGDMRKVRPSIRAMEMAFRDIEEEEREWADKFWAQCLSETPCFPLKFDSSIATPAIGTTIDHVQQVYGLLVKHNIQTRKTSGIDPRHDTVLGIGLFCLSILKELLRIGASQSITARMGLRTIVECLISLAYLIHKDDSELWKSYRAFGAGQAKLAYLKLEEMGEELSFVNVETLERLANEDVWEEFLPIELGHWGKLDTRKLSEVAGVKDEYDRFYGWTSTFAHGHWGAIRETVYDTCGNPLHRLHRIPRESARSLLDVLPDACSCVDRILELISSCYPEFPHRVTLKNTEVI
jgi:hypothetical protein